MHPKLFKYFCICDKSSYIAKQEFYILKREILINEGTPDGYDERIVSKKNKLGPRKEVHYLLRYILNDKVFHLSCNRRPEGDPKEVIYGLKFYVTDLDETYHALLVLFLNYAPDRINNIADNTIVKKILQDADKLQDEIYINQFMKAVNQ